MNLQVRVRQSIVKVELLLEDQLFRKTVKDIIHLIRTVGLKQRSKNLKTVLTKIAITYRITLEQ